MYPPLGELELEALRALASGEDAFEGCCAAGDYGRRLMTLAALRRRRLIDQHDCLTEAGRGLLRQDR